MRPADRASEQPTFIAVLGASNVTLSLPRIVDELLRHVPQELAELAVAHGPGRSYGLRAGIGPIHFEPLRESPLLDEVEESCRLRARPKVHALLTDIGNDIPYGVEIDRLMAWIEEIVGRFQQIGGAVAVTSIPVESVLSMSSWKYHVVRRIYFPTCPLSRKEVRQRVVSAQERLEKLGAALGLDVLPTRTEWYGFDHFHVKRRCRQIAFGRWIRTLLCPHKLSGDERQQRVPLKVRHRILHRPRVFVFDRELQMRRETLRVTAGANLRLY